MFLKSCSVFPESNILFLNYSGNIINNINRSIYFFKKYFLVKQYQNIIKNLDLYVVIFFEYFYLFFLLIIDGGNNKDSLIPYLIIGITLEHKFYLFKINHYLRGFGNS